MRVIFLPEGGFEKNGGFIEVPEGQEPTGKEEVYQRQGFLRLRLKCRDAVIKTNRGIANEMPLPTDSGEAGEADPRNHRWISATGDIQRSRWSEFRLSILGNQKTHSSVEISIREDETEAVFSAGLRAQDDLDLNIPERFYVEAVVTPERMNEILGELSEPGASLNVYAEIWKFSGFYAPWSPAIDDGRVIKFLYSRQDVENAGDVPEAFWNKDHHKKMLSDRDRPPVVIEVSRPLGFQSQPQKEEPDLSEYGPETGASADVRQQAASTSQDALASVAIAREIRLASTRLATWIGVLSVAVLVAGFLV